MKCFRNTRLFIYYDKSFSEIDGVGKVSNKVFSVCMKEVKKFDFSCISIFLILVVHLKLEKKNHDLTVTLFSTIGHNVNNSYTSHLQNIHFFTKLFTFHQNYGLKSSTLNFWIYKMV